MHTIETYTLHGLCLRLIHGIAASRAEALILAQWIADHPAIFGSVPPVVPAGRHKPGIDPQSWQMIGAHITDRLQNAVEPPDQSLARLQAIAMHLGLSFEEQTILRFLALQQRKGVIADFALMLKRKIGLSDEAMIAWCCNLDEDTTWTVLAPQGRLVTLGLLQTDSTMAVLRDDPYNLSGLLLALIQPSLAQQVPGARAGRDSNCHPSR
jgi:hypothetical protein